MEQHRPGTTYARKLGRGAVWLLGIDSNLVKGNGVICARNDMIIMQYGHMWHSMK